MQPTPNAEPELSIPETIPAADQLLNTLPWGVLVVDEQHIIRRVNQQAARWGSGLPEALLGRPLAEAGLPPAVSAALQQLLEPGETTPREVFLPHQEQWIALTAARQPGGWALYGQDITLQKQREQQYQALAENTPDVLTRWTPDLRLRYANAAFATEAGVPLGELLGHTNREMGQSENLAGPYMAALQRVFDTGQPQEHFNQFPTAQGEVQYYSRLIPELRDGQIDTVLSIARDVTTLRQAEQAAQHSRALLQSVFEAVPHSIMVLEAVRDEHHQVVDFRYQLTNGVADRHMGLDLKGRLLRNLLPGYLDEENFRLLAETVETGQPTERTQHYDSLGGPLWLHSRYRKLGERVVVSHEDVTASKQAEQEALRLHDELAQRATDKYHALFYAMNQGFCLLEVLFDEAGQQAVDCRYLELNPVFAQQLDIPADTQGKTIRELMPDVEPFWFDTFGQVARTGTAVRLERYLPRLDRWFDVHAFRVGTPEACQVAVLFTDISTRKLTEAALQYAAEAETFQLQLADALRPLADPVEVQRVALRLLGEHLQLDRCGYAAIQADDENATIDQDYHAPDVVSFAGTYRLDAFGPGILATMQRGETLAIDNMAEDPANVDPVTAATYAANEVRALLAAPLVKQGQLVAILFAHHRTPRCWQPSEVALLEEVAERTWAAVERTQAEEAQRVSEEKYRMLFTSMDEGYCIIEVHFDAEGRVCDWLYLDVNPAFEKISGLVNATGKTIRELMPGTELKWFDIYGRVAQTGESIRAEGDSPTFNQWFSLYAFRVGEPGQHQVAVIFTDVSARKLAEAALRQSEEQLRSFVTASSDVLYRMTADWQRMLQLDGKGFLADTKAPHASWLETYIPLADQPAVNAAMQAAIEGRHFFEMEHRVVRADNSVGWTFSRAVPVLNERGELAEWFGTATDITARKQAEAVLAADKMWLEHEVTARTESLQQNRDLLRSVLDTSLISMSVLHAVRDEAGQVLDFRIGLVNRELERETGRTDLVGKLYAAEYPGIRLVGIFDLMLQTLTTNQPQGMEYFYEHEGFHQWFSCQFMRMGEALVATNLDITARKQAEQERISNLRLLEQAEAVANLGSWDYNLLNRDFLWSDGMYQLFGLPLGQPVRPEIYLRYVVDEDRPQAERLVAGITLGTGNFEETLRLRVGEEVKTVRVKVVVLYDEAGQATRVLGVDLDVSELQRLEADNLRLRLTQQQSLFEAVQAAQETERKRMAESLHNGIGQILYATKLRLDRLHTPPLETNSSLTTARHEADQLLSEAIRQTRVLSHELVPMVLEEFGLAAALQDVGRKMSTPQLRLHSHVLLDEAAVSLAPPLQMALYRMAQELAQNITKHAHGATEASLELETMPGWVLLRAEDNGAGFAPPALTESPGLGLRSIRDRVSLLGGQLEAGAVPTGGAYVRIRIPLPAAPTS
ncbi:MAG: PAS domain-containing protein [Janthinobacterium lividum]